MKDGVWFEMIGNKGSRFEHDTQAKPLPWTETADPSTNTAQIGKTLVSRPPIFLIDGPS
jgi:hypothetical protein